MILEFIICFFETSAKTGKGINQCLEGLIEKITFRYENSKDKYKVINSIIEKSFKFFSTEKGINKSFKFLAPP